MPKNARTIMYGGLGCDSIAGSVFGNILLIDRGVCSFGAKAILAEKMGAEAIVIVNTGRVYYNIY